MPERPTRRRALKTVAAAALPVAVGARAGATPLVQIATPYRPRSLSADQFRLVTTLVDIIIPPTQTPGAAAAGVDRYVDEELAADDTKREKFRQGLKLLEKAGFSSLDEAKQVELLTEYSRSSDLRGTFFHLLKELTIDGYYSTEIGLVQELGYQGNTYLKEFPGCRHEESH